jgi:hypothetical protein
MNSILAIDPGPVVSAYVVLDGNLKPIRFGMVDNAILNDIIICDIHLENPNIKYVAIEMIASYGMAVGKEVFETCVWIGRFTETALKYFDKVGNIYRKDEKMNLCHTMKAKDGNIRQALIDRFGVVGTKKDPGWFYGVSKDVWAAIAVGVTYHDMYLNKKAV